MSVIRTIDANSAKLITAGQVIVNIASVLKELAENAVDAKCTELTISVTDFGLTSIVVSDNGEGFPSPPTAPPQHQNSSDIADDNPYINNTIDNTTIDCSTTSAKSPQHHNCESTNKSSQQQQHNPLDFESEYSPLRRRASSKFSFAKIGALSEEGDEGQEIAGELDTSASLGFRGEALFSLSQHSDVCIETKNDTDLHVRILTSAGIVQEDSGTNEASSAAAASSSSPIRFYTRAAGSSLASSSIKIEQNDAENTALVPLSNPQSFVTVPVVQRRPPTKNGTTVYCYNLFKRYAVRLADYNKNKKKYLADATRVIKLLAIAHPEVRVVLEHRETAASSANTATKVERLVTTGGSNDRFRALSEVVGGRLTNTLQLVKWPIKLPSSMTKHEGVAADELDVTESTEFDEQIGRHTEILVEGYVSKIGSGRSSGDYQTLILDGRVVGFPKLFTALTEVYRHGSANCDSRTFPAAFLWMSTFNNISVDVNLAPNKEKVLVGREGEVVNAVAEAASQTFKGNVEEVPIISVGTVGRATTLAAASSSSFTQHQPSQGPSQQLAFSRKGSSGGEVKLHPLGSQVLLPSTDFQPTPMAFATPSAVVLPSQRLTQAASPSQAAVDDASAPFALFSSPKQSENITRVMPNNTLSQAGPGGKASFAALMTGGTVKGGYGSSSLADPNPNKFVPPMPAQVVLRPSTHTVKNEVKHEERNIDSQNDSTNKNTDSAPNATTTQDTANNGLETCAPHGVPLAGNCSCCSHPHLEPSTENTITPAAAVEEEVYYDDYIYSTPSRLTQLTTSTATASPADFVLFGSPVPHRQHTTTITDGHGQPVTVNTSLAALSSAASSIPPQPQPPYYSHKVGRNPVPFIFPIKRCPLFDVDIESDTLVKDEMSDADSDGDVIVKAGQSTHGASLRQEGSVATSSSIDFSQPAPALINQDGALLSSMINKADFLKMKVVGQFNRGFIVVTLPHDVAVKKLKVDPITKNGSTQKKTANKNTGARNKNTGSKRAREEEEGRTSEKKDATLVDDADGPTPTERILSTFIVDQHASDEKCNYERLLETLVIKAQPLLRPVSVHVDERELELAIEHKEELLAHGFMVDRQYMSVDVAMFDDDIEKAEEEQDVIDSRNKNVESRPKRQVAVPCSLLVTGVPILPYETVSPIDVLELTQQLVTYGRIVRRMKAVWHSVATKACRSSIMIGKTLDARTMERILQRMGALEQPWSCPHGRPTMRFLGHVREGETEVK